MALRTETNSVRGFQKQAREKMRLMNVWGLRLRSEVHNWMSTLIRYLVLLPKSIAFVLLPLALTSRARVVVTNTKVMRILNKRHMYIFLSEAWAPASAGTVGTHAKPLYNCNIVAPGHPCRFPLLSPFFSFLFFSFLFFLRFFSLLSVVLRVPCLVPFSFVCPFVLSFSVWLLYRLLRFYFRFPAFPLWRILLFCYFVSALHPPRAPCEPEVGVFPLRAVFFSFFLALLMLTYLQICSLPSLFRFQFGQRFFFILSFSCGYYAVSSVSVSAATRSAYSYVWYIYMYLDTYVRWSHIFILDWGIRFVSVIVCFTFCFYLFSSWGNFPLQSYWSLSCDHGLHCSHDLMWEH